MFKALFRPVGVKELALILDSNAKEFPPRLSWQPIFYPVLNFEYAAQIARDWNTQDNASGYAGFVTRFYLSETYLQKFPVQNVGGSIHDELWVPANELAEFNHQISGDIAIVAQFFGDDYKDTIHQQSIYLQYYKPLEK